MNHARSVVTTFFNSLLVNDPNCELSGVTQLRELQVQLDQAILDCYGLPAPSIEHGFFPDVRGRIRYGLAPTSSRNLVRMLIELNHSSSQKGQGQC